MAKIVLPNVTNADTLSTINSNFQKIVAEFQDKTAYRDNPVGETNTVKNPLDLNGNDIFNIDTINIQDMVVKGVPVSGDDLSSIPSLAINVSELQADVNATEISLANTISTVNNNAVIENVNNRASLRLPSGTLNPLNEGAGRAGRFIAFDGSGNPITSTGTGADAGLRTDLANPTGVDLLGFTQEFGGVVQDAGDKLKKLKSFDDYYTNPAVDNRAVIQALLDAAPAYSVIKVNRLKISDALLITKPVILDFDGPGSVIEMTVWGRPHFVVDAVSDVVFRGHVNLTYEGARPLITTLPTSSDSRLAAIYAAVGSSPGNPRTLATGVYLRQKCDRFTADHISVRGQVSGVVQATANVYADYSDECSIGQLDVDTVDWGYLSGGFKRLTFGIINAKNITSTQGDPTHAIYVGPRTTRNGILSIGELNVDGCTIITDASDQLRAADAFSIRGTEIVNIGSIQLRNAQYLGNFQDGRFTVGSIRAVLDSLLSGTISTDLAVPFAVQNNADVTIGQWNVESALGWDTGKQPSFFISVSSGGKLKIAGGSHIMTAAKPGNLARTSGTAKLLDIRGLDVEYVADFDAGYTNPAVYLATALGASGSFRLYDPSLKGTDKLFLATVASIDWRVFLNPAKIENNTANSIIDNSGVYHVNFLSWPDVAPAIAPFVGTGAVQTRGRRVVSVNNVAAASLAAIHSGSTPNQDYMITCNDNFTTITNNANIVTKSGANIPVGWKWFLYRVIGTVAYEVAHV